MIKNKKNKTQLNLNNMTKYIYSAWLNQYGQDAPIATIKETTLTANMTASYIKLSPGIYQLRITRNDEDILTNALPFINQGFTGFTNKLSTEVKDLGVYIRVEGWTGTEYEPMDGEMPANTSFKVEFWVEE